MLQGSRIIVVDIVNNCEYPDIVSITKIREDYYKQRFLEKVHVMSAKFLSAKEELAHTRELGIWSSSDVVLLNNEDIRLIYKKNGSYILVPSYTRWARKQSRIWNVNILVANGFVFVTYSCIS